MSVILEDIMLGAPPISDRGNWGKLSSLVLEDVARSGSSPDAMVAAVSLPGFVRFNRGLCYALRFSGCCGPRSSVAKRQRAKMSKKSHGRRRSLGAAGRKCG